MTYSTAGRSLRRLAATVAAGAALAAAAPAAADCGNQSDFNPAADRLRVVSAIRASSVASRSTTSASRPSA